MKKLLVLALLTMFLTSCGMLDRGNYDENRSGYVLSGDLIVNYHTNSVGEIDVFLIDQVFTYFEALNYAGFDMSSINTYSRVSDVELNSCGVDYNYDIPKFIRIEEKTYYFNVRDNGYCTFDEYEFHSGTVEPVETPIEPQNVTLFKNADFVVNTFETIIFIEEITYDTLDETYEKDIVSVLPMSIKQAGTMFEDNSDFIEEVGILEKYVLDNQSINLLVLQEDYLNENVNNIWSDYTIEVLGRDHDIIKSVRIKKTGDILEIIEDTLSRLGMF
jgi:hypothetical protein